jgi:hypothetical protein
MRCGSTRWHSLAAAAGAQPTTDNRQRTTTQRSSVTPIRGLSATIGSTEPARGGNHARDQRREQQRCGDDDEGREIARDRSGGNAVQVQIAVVQRPANLSILQIR